MGGTHIICDELIRDRLQHERSELALPRERQADRSDGYLDESGVRPVRGRVPRSQDDEEGVVEYVVQGFLLRRAKVCASWGGRRRVGGLGGLGGEGGGGGSDHFE